MEVRTFTATIYVAGDLHEARTTCRHFCMEGLCVTVTPTTFIYQEGAEEGVAVGLVNYPRFPKTDEEIWEIAIRLGSVLMAALCQKSYLIVSPDKTHWFRKEERVK